MYPSFHIIKVKCCTIAVLSLLFILFSLTCCGFQTDVYPLTRDIPNPKNEGRSYISDPEGILSGNQKGSLNAILDTLDQKTGVEAAVVLINDFDPNQDDFTFATNLFREWGIGKRQADNGLLLFVSINRRQYRFITGYGVEGLLPDGDLKTIGERALVPAFKQQKYGDGVINTMQIIVRYLQQPANKKELNALLAKSLPHSSPVANSGLSAKALRLIAALLFWAVAVWQIQRFKSKIPKSSMLRANLYTDVTGWVGMVLIGFVALVGIILFFSGHVMRALSAFVSSYAFFGYTWIWMYLFFAHLMVLSRMRRHYQDDVNFTGAVKHFYKQAWWHFLLSPLTIIFMLIEVRRATRLQDRMTPLFDDQGNPMQRLDRDQLVETEDYLSAGQLKEEQIGSLAYDIWISPDSSKPTLIAHPGYEFSHFDQCPKCGFRTLSQPVKITLRRATYTHSGEAKRVNLCRQCNFEKFIETIILARLTQSSGSSSSSSSSGSSSRSSSSSSSSWGGGSTGGGGAGGSW